MAYGAIVRGIVRAGGAGTTVAVPHALGDAVHCSFVIQDATGGAANQVYGAAFVSQAGKGANTENLTDNTAAGAPGWSVLTVAAYSRFDIGPIVNGITRSAAQVSSWARTGATPLYPGRPAMRSLHYNVTGTINNGASTSAAITITHRLGTTNVVAFSSPTSNPLVGTAGGNRPMILSHVASPTVDTVTLQAQTVDNANNNTGNPVAVTFDVMVVCRVGSGFHSSITRPHGQGTIPLGTFVAGDDYAAGDRQLTVAASGRAGGPASYGALYTNVDGLVVAPGVAYTHNMGSAVGCMALIGVTGAVGAGTVGTGTIVNNATSATTMTLGRVDADINNAEVMFVRAYSPYLLLVS